jgi:hypothetical protein
MPKNATRGEPGRHTCSTQVPYDVHVGQGWGEFQSHEDKTMMLSLRYVLRKLPVVVLFFRWNAVISRQVPRSTCITIPDFHLTEVS